jgi:hypothetical protein
MTTSLNNTLGEPETDLEAGSPNHTSKAVDGAAAAPGQGEPPKNRIPEIPVSQVRHVQSQEELDEVLAAHSLWVEQVLDPDVEVARGRANLSGVDLRGFSLREANLSGANLSKANLAEVDLTSANLSAANLTGAILACATLCGAKLRGAKLEGADLRGTDLTGAYLQGVDLSRCTLKTPEPPAAKTTAKEHQDTSQDPGAPESSLTMPEETPQNAAESLDDESKSEGTEHTPASPLFGEQISYIVL